MKHEGINCKCQTRNMSTAIAKVITWSLIVLILGFFWTYIAKCLFNMVS